jgi:lysophospholipid acyltransferase (LPLAT)-like uncharacterized protein
MKRWWRRHRNRVYAPIGYVFVQLLLRSIRYRCVNEGVLDALPNSAILCGLHSRGLLFSYYLRNRGYWVLISKSNDGELQNYLFSRLNYRTIRGSTGRDGIKATIEAIKALKNPEARLLVAIDGPKGPRGIVQQGVLLMAKKSGAVVVPGGISVNRRWTLRTWDFYCLPKPFAKAVIVIGKPVLVPSGASEEELESIRQTIEDEIHRLDNEADRLTGYVADPNEKREALPFTP